MPYTVNESKQYDQPAAAVYQAALGAVGGLEGKFLKQDDAGMQFSARFHKTILGKTLGDRTEFRVKVSQPAEGQTDVEIEGFPVDAVGRKLMFGARKGVTSTVMSWFVAHLEHRLK